MDFKEEFVVYVLLSPKYNKTYTGYTSNLIQRFLSHNHLSKKGWSIKYRPWTVIYIKFFHSKKEAMAHEKFLKSGKGREFIKSLKSSSSGSYPPKADAGEPVPATRKTINVSWWFFCL